MMTTSRLTPVGLRVEALHAPLGVGTATPTFSWQLQSSDDNALQAAWQVQLAVTTDFETVIWDSGRVEGDLPFGHRPDFPVLESMTRYSWRVRAWSIDPAEPAWSAPAEFETGILDASLWVAHWVAAPGRPEFEKAPTYFRGTTTITAKVVRARAYASALGWYQLFVNGHDFTGSSLVPRYTPFDKTVEYQVYDVTEAFQTGSNVLAMTVGDGRFRGHVGYFDRRKVYGSRLAGFLQVVIDFDDGTRQLVSSDESWTAGLGPIMESDPKFGEKVDLRRADPRWNIDVMAPRAFVPVEVLPSHPRELISEAVPRVTDVARFTPTVWRSPQGEQLVDLGQNIAGVLRIKLSGPAGRTVRMTFSEALTPDGEFDAEWIIQNPKKPWSQRDEVILDGAEQWWQPSFTIHGFRYAKVEGLEHDLVGDDVEGIALSSDLRSAGSFDSSDERLNRLWQNVLWSTRSNFTDTPTDCPTRERSGWTGDIQAFAPTATGLLDSQAFLGRYLENVAIEQKPNGNVSPWSPSERSGGEAGFLAHIVTDFLGNSVGWGDVTVLTPWVLYQTYGDEQILAKQFESMTRWVRRLQRAARIPARPTRLFRPKIGLLERYIVDVGFHWGEWLRPGEEFPANFFDGSTDGGIVATAYFEHSARTLADVAEVLGKVTDERTFRSLADRTRAAWRAAFVHEGGKRIGRDLQDDYVRALGFGLLNEQERHAAGRRLVELIKEAGTHLGTGFLSTPMLLPALVDTGHVDIAYELLMQNTSPSWLYAVERGATTTWETWEGHDDTGRARASQNHYALGSVAGWLREGMLGVTPLAPGYRRVLVSPSVGRRMSHAAGTVETPFGTIATRWALRNGHGSMTVQLPAGMEGTVVTPNGDRAEVGSGTHKFVWEDTPDA